MDIEPSQAAARQDGVEAARLSGAVLVATAAVAAYVLRVGGRCCDGLIARDLYDQSTWLLVLGLAAVGGLLLVAQRAWLRVVACSAGGVLAAQLAGTGVVAIRRWVPVGGFGHGTWDNLIQLRTVSALLAICSIGSVVACAMVLRSEEALPAAVRPVLRGLAVATGLVIIVTLPIVAADGHADVLDKTSIGAHSLIYSLPFGVSLILTGWLTRTAALAVAAAVALSALALADPIRALVSTPGHTSALVLVLIGAIAVLVSRLLERPHSSSRPAPG